MSDLLEQLRAWPGECDCMLGSKAADEIERLDASLALMDALLTLSLQYIDAVTSGESVYSKESQALKERIDELRNRDD